MIDAMLDTDVIIETLRGRTEAGDWLRSVGSQHIGISVLVRMEILQGAQNRREQTLLSREMSRYTLVHLEHTDSETGLGWFESFHLSHGAVAQNSLLSFRASVLCERGISVPQRDSSLHSE